LAGNSILAKGKTISNILGNKMLLKLI